MREATTVTFLMKTVIVLLCTVADIYIFFPLHFAT